MCFPIFFRSQKYYKIFTKLSKYGFEPFDIQERGVKKTQDPGSGSETLDYS